MVPGCTGAAAALSDNVLAGLLPQVFDAVTLSVPFAEPAVTVMLLVVELPVQPEGNTQL
jgi:hypothetical protein